MEVKYMKKGEKMSEEQKLKQSSIMKGRQSPRKGVKLKESTKEKIRLANIGKIIPKETKNKISESLKGRKFSKEHLEKISKSLKGRKGGFVGKNHSKETKIKMSESQTGEKGSGWLGGKSFEKYTLDWTNSLRISIRERDRYTCKICGEKQGDRAFSVHHIDYNKKNCNPDNLITLCGRCHPKTNSNREYWIEYFKNVCKI